MRLLIKLLILNDFNLRIYNIFEANDLNTNDKTQLKFWKSVNYCFPTANKNTELGIRSRMVWYAAFWVEESVIYIY